VVAVEVIVAEVVVSKVSSRRPSASPAGAPAARETTASRFEKVRVTRSTKHQGTATITTTSTTTALNITGVDIHLDRYTVRIELVVDVRILVVREAVKDQWKRCRRAYSRQDGRTTYA
jgi:hypothetical protein